MMVRDYLQEAIDDAKEARKNAPWEIWFGVSGNGTAEFPYRPHSPYEMQNIDHEYLQKAIMMNSHDHIG